MMLGNSSSLRKGRAIEGLHVLVRRLHLPSTSRGLLTRLVTAGSRWSSRPPNFHHQMNRGGRRLTKAGKHTGQHYPKLHKLVGS